VENVNNIFQNISQIKSEGESTFDAYTAYIDHEMSAGDPSRIQCVFERAVKDNCLYPQLWTRYIKYLVSITFNAYIIDLFTLPKTKVAN